MHCDEFRNRLDIVLDERGKPARNPALRAHARRCPDCAELMIDQVRLLNAVHQLPVPQPRADFGIQVLQSLEANQRVVQRERRRRWQCAAAVLAAAAAVLLITFSGRDNLSDPAAKSPHRAAQQVTAIGYEQLLYGANDLTREQRAWVTELAQGLKPVQSSVHSALRTLWCTLPAHELARRLL